MSVQKKVPERTCIACKQTKPKKELIRIVKSNTNEFSLDETGKKSGRGAYICKNVECLEILLKNKALNRAFKTEVPKEFYEGLRQELIKNIE